MTLTAIANVLERSDGRTLSRRTAHQATELLLQERAPGAMRQPPSSRDGPNRGAVPAWCRRRPAFRSPHTRFPHTQFLSNGNYIAVGDNAGGGASTWRGRPGHEVAAGLRPETGRQFIYLRDVRSGAIWSATYQPTAKEPDEYASRFPPTRPPSSARAEDVSTRLDIAVSPEDDVEVRRLTVQIGHTHAAKSRSRATPRSSSRHAANDLAHPAFGKLFVETETCRDAAALLCHRRPRASGSRSELGGSTS